MTSTLLQILKVKKLEKALSHYYLKSVSFTYRLTIPLSGGNFDLLGKGLVGKTSSDI